VVYVTEKQQVHNFIVAWGAFCTVFKIRHGIVEYLLVFGSQIIMGGPRVPVGLHVAIGENFPLPQPHMKSKSGNH
jgi:hypothetical protein